MLHCFGSWGCELRLQVETSDAHGNGNLILFTDAGIK
jgi:hypothetical protein